MGRPQMEGNGMIGMNHRTNDFKTLETSVSWIFSLLILLFTTVSPAVAAKPVTNQTHLIVVVGAAGEKEFGEQFRAWAEMVPKAAEKAGAKLSMIGIDKAGKQSDLDQLKKLITAAAADTENDLWLILIGHGTYDGRFAKFNLRGPDVSSAHLAEWLVPVTRPLAIINCASSSGPFLKPLAGPNRVIITSTKNGMEQNFSRFGRYFSASLASPQADLDQDDQTSLLEAFLKASKDTLAFYESEGKLATEHALLDDNADGFGTRPDFFRGVRAVKKAAGGQGIDGLRAHQFHLVRSEFEAKLSTKIRNERNRLELAIERHRARKPRMKEDLYYSELEKLMITLAKLYQGVEKTIAGK
jgi:hypothetical protein